MSNKNETSEKPISKGLEAGVEQSAAEVKQPVTMQPNPAMPVPVMTPVTIVQPVANNVPIETRFCECNDTCWWCSCCFGIWFHSCTGLFMNLKLDKTMSNCTSILWLLYIIIEIIGAALFWAGMMIWDETGFIMRWVGIGIIVLVNIPKIWSRFVQRQVFLRKQAETGNLPNYEGCCTTFLLTWLCSPCIFGQINAALEKQNQQQRFVHVV